MLLFMAQLSHHQTQTSQPTLRSIFFFLKFPNKNFSETYELQQFDDRQSAKCHFCSFLFFSDNFNTWKIFLLSLCKRPIDSSYKFRLWSSREASCIQNCCVWACGCGKIERFYTIYVNECGSIYRCVYGHDAEYFESSLPAWKCFYFFNTEEENKKVGRDVIDWLVEGLLKFACWFIWLNLIQFKNILTNFYFTLFSFDLS